MTILTASDNASARSRIASGIAGIYDWFGNVSYNCVKSYLAYRECQIAIAKLHGFSDYELRDIGLPRGSIEAAVYGLYSVNESDRPAQGTQPVSSSRKAPENQKTLRAA
jgi:uncharacterized protein YjiS (DUF1127 family)